ncbi:NAD(P)H-dependent oxidoreductase [Pseudomonas sp. PvP001]|uniref:NAD(P)H-dependent oxidoreductase n=1 Tax=Pseudomonas sp. PvP001 TaxID=3158559 RepID=UPI0033976750
MINTLVVVAHPDLSSSRINATWCKAIEGLAGVTVNDLYGRYPTGKIDIGAEQKLITAHDRIILQFPMQWYNCTPLLKQWIDDVFAAGWAYGGGRAVAGKTLCIAVSTYSKASDYEKDGRYGRTLDELTSPFEVLAFRVEMLYQPGFFLSGSENLSDESLAVSASRYRQWVAGAQCTYGGRKAQPVTS